jgi:2-oxoglutarate dehydrogenase E2 component (dihydrolipoamide succinyltransferase)
MPVNIVVPELGESVLEATVSHWLKQPGDRVAAGEAVVELETEKVNLEVGAEKAGVLARIERQEGEDVRIGDVLAVLEVGEADGEQSPAPASTGYVEQTTPGSGEASRRDATDRAERQAAASQDADPPDSTGKGDGQTKAAGPAGDRAATPVARRMAEDAGIDLAQIVSASEGRRITKQDVQAYMAQQQGPGEAEAGLPAGDKPVQPEVPTSQQTPSSRRPPSEGERSPADPAHQPATTGGGREALEDRVRLSRRRRTIARRLVEAQQTAAMLTTFNELDMSAVMEVRKRRRDAFKERHGVGLGFMSFFVKASVGALKAFPTINAELQDDELIIKHYYDIGMAVGADEGLVVPVVRAADRLSFAEIERQIEAFVGKVRDGRLTLDDLRGGTFTITNGGVFGSLLSTPILNPPQVGILGLHKIEERPIARQGEVVIRPMMYVALSYDHRIVDGREAVQFLVKIKELIEDPETLLLEG